MSNAICTECGGEGETVRFSCLSSADSGQSETYERCEACYGTGEVHADCAECNYAVPAHELDGNGRCETCSPVEPIGLSFEVNS